MKILTYSQGHLYLRWYLAAPTNPCHHNLCVLFRRSNLSLISAFTWFHHLCFGLIHGRLPSGFDFITVFSPHSSSLLSMRSPHPILVHFIAHVMSVPVVKVPDLSILYFSTPLFTCLAHIFFIDRMASLQQSFYPQTSQAYYRLLHRWYQILA